MHRYTDENGLQMVLDLDDRDRLTSIRAVAALTTVGLGAVAWVIALQQMNSMDTLRVTGPGSLASFISLWVLMMAAMMLPGAAPAVCRHAYASETVRGLLLFVGSYLAVWALSGVALYAVYSLYRPHGFDVPLALAIVGLGILIVVAPASVPGFMPPM